MKRLSPLLGLFLLFVLSACSSKTIQMYTLESGSRAAAGGHGRYSSIRVDYPAGIEDTMGTRIYFSRSELTQSYYRYSQWSKPLNRILMADIIEALQRSGLARNVIDYASEANADYELETTVYRFEHRITPQGSFADISIGLRLLRSDDKSLVKSRNFNYHIPCKSTDARGFVEAADEAMHRLSTAMLLWLKS